MDIGWNAYGQIVTFGSSSTNTTHTDEEFVPLCSSTPLETSISGDLTHTSIPD